MVPDNARSAALAAAFEAAALSDPRSATVRRELGERARADTTTGVTLIVSLGGLSSGRPVGEVGEVGEVGSSCARRTT